MSSYSPYLDSPEPPASRRPRLTRLLLGAVVLLFVINFAVYGCTLIPR